MFNVRNNIAPEITKGLFDPRISPYDPRNNYFLKGRVNSVWHGTELVSYLGPKTSDIVPVK